jgi:uncharacterized membrane protein YccC
MVDNIIRSMREDLVRLCLHERMPRRAAFESLAYDRVSQLMPFAQRIGRKADKVFGGSIVSVAVGLETLRLRKVLAAGGLPPEAAQTVAGFLKLLAREMIVRAPGDLAHTVAAIRSQAAAIALVETENSLQAAASFRIIAAALEDYPEFFRRA